MKANELMIGDWVLYGEKPRQVRYINDRVWWDGSCHNDEIGFTHHEDEWIAAHNAKPIPLTAEILAKNGFENYELQSWSLREQWQWSVTIHLYENGSVISINKEIEGHKGVDSCHICYKGNVHELQHTLRLCGLNELADNFKIE